MTHRLLQYFTLTVLLTICATAENADNKKPKNTGVSDKPITLYKSPKLSDRFQKIVHNGKYTFIPKGSILYIPADHKTKVTLASGTAKVLNWDKFYAQNQSLLHRVSLNKAQALGNKGKDRYIMPYEKLEDLKKLGRIIICTYNNTPVKIKVQPKPVE